MTNVPPLAPAEELRRLDQELLRLDVHRAQLLQRRAWLLRALNAPVPPPARPGVPVREAAPQPGPSAQNVLLTLGGILLAVAALAFTLVGWGQLGIAGRSAVLALVTAATLAAPVLLIRRGLVATAESVAVLGLVLTLLDAYALRQVAFPDADGTSYTAAAATALTALWASYGLLLPRLRTPLPAALLLAQLPLSLWALSHSTTPTPVLWALLATAALDTIVALHRLPPRPPVRPTPPPAAATPNTRGTTPATPHQTPASAGGSPASPAASTPAAPTPGAPASPAAPTAAPLGAPHPAAAQGLPAPDARPSAAASGAPFAGAPGTPRPGGVPVPGAALRVLAAVLAWAAGAVALLAALFLSGLADSLADTPRSSALLLAGGALALSASLRRLQTATAVVAGLAATAAVGGLLRPVLPLAWTVPLYLACALAVLAAPRLARPVRHGLAWSSAAVTSGAVLSTLPALTLTLMSGPLSALAAPWRGLPGTLRAPLADGEEWHLPWQAMSTAPLILLASAAALALFHRRRPHPASAVGAVLLTAAALLAVPLAVNLPYVAGLALYVVVAATALTLAALSAPSAASHAALASGAVASVTVSFLAVASRGSTFAVLGVLFLLWLAPAVRTTAPALRPLGAVACVAYALALACASGAALGLPVRHTALLALAVPALVALLAVRVRSVPMEIAGAASALVPLALAAVHLPTFSLALALCGVIAAATAVRPERRAVGWAAGGLFVAATWARLAASEIADPEAYTIPASVLALTVGVLRRRRDPQASSWTAYGPGLSMTLVPSLVAAWADPHWLRPLLLGVAALVVTLLGARFRLGAPLLLGAVVLSLVSLHELAPYAVQVVDALPRWLPPALAGMLLLAVGATYEQRLRDARRLRERIGRLQ
ncbi:SCO7613 C-terminal domain-containing membrane protein [Streptomyces sp. NPDC087440]|uniref:SCO7613 C-terminal domain-containing membrane protein n=1 Tax=Streptomyces sp. NPDC087440 TaxID=3365790 RepID=UPI0038019558